MTTTITDRLNGLSTSVAVKAPCKAVSTTTLTLSGEQTIGGVSCTAGDRVLYALSGGSTSNGIWVVSTGSWSRAKDFDGNRDVVHGTMVLVSNPSSSGATLYRVTTTGSITIGTTSIEFTPAGTSDADNINFDATGSYLAGTVGGWLRQDISVFRYIPPAEHAAILDGTSTYDAYTKVKEAIDAAVAIGGPVRVIFPTGKYRLDTALGYFTASDITIDFQGSTLDFSNASSASATALIGFTGTYGSTAALTGNASSGQATVSVNSTGFLVGDWVRIYSSSIWDSTRTSTKIGEISVVDTVPGGTSVTLVNDLESTYNTADTATLQKLTPCRNVHVLNGRFIAPSTDNLYIGVDLKLCVGSSIERMRTLRCDVLHLRLLDCVQSHVRGCDMDESSNATQAYGISFTDACQDCTATGNSMRNLRHAFTTNNTTSTSYGITRRCLVAHNTVFNNVPNSGGSSGDALDTHAGADQITFIGNIVQGAYGIGLNAECRSLIAIGNTINGATSAGIRHAPYADYTSSTLISGNYVENIGDNTDTNDYGIRVVVPTGVLAGNNKCVVSGNRVSSKNACIQLEANATYKITQFAVTGNVTGMRAGLTGATNIAIDLIYAQHGTVTGNRAKATALGISLQDATHVAVNGNSVEITGTSGSTGYGIRTSGTTSYLSVAGNTCYYSDTGIVTTVGVSFGGTTTYSGAWNNVTQGFGTNVNVGAGAGVASANNI